MSCLYVYRLTSNTGFAPCTQDGLLSLTCCKPAIRRVTGRLLTTGETDSAWILGIVGTTLDRYEVGRWLYAAKVTKAVPFIEYFTDPKYQNRTDCIYKIENPEAYTPGDHSRLKFSHNGLNSHHLKPEEWDHDWGVTPKGRSKECYALLSTHYHWFSDDDPNPLGEKYSAYFCKGRPTGVYEASEEFCADIDRLIAKGT